MRTLSILVFLSVLVACEKDPPVPSVLPFLNFYGGSGDETGRETCVIDNGDIVTCGYGAGPNGGNDLLLLATDENGNRRWLKHYGGAGNEICWAMDKTSDGGFVLGGYTNSFGAGGDDFYIVKTDADGNELWSRTYGGPGNDNAIGIRALAGGFILCGIRNYATDDNAWILRLDENGDSLWSCTWGGNGGDGAMSVCEGPGGSHVITGYTNSTVSGGTDGFLLLLSDSGTQLALYNYGTPEYDEPHSVAPAVDGNGWVISGHYGDDVDITTHHVFITAIASNGTLRWHRIYGGAQHDGSEDLCVSGQTYAVCARSNSRAGFGEDVYFLQVDVDGSALQERWLGTDADDAGYGVAADGSSFVLSGTSRGGGFGGKDVLLMRVVW